MVIFKTSTNVSFYFDFISGWVTMKLICLFQAHSGVGTSDCLLIYLFRNGACGVFVEENSLTLAVCWSEQFQVQRINLLKNLQGSQGPSDPPEDGW